MFIPIQLSLKISDRLYIDNLCSAKLEVIYSYHVQCMPSSVHKMRSWPVGDEFDLDFKCFKSPHSDNDYGHGHYVVWLLKNVWASQRQKIAGRGNR